MLLRAETSGVAFDVRSGHRWGLGAETMLRAGYARAPNQQGRLARQSGFDNSFRSDLFDRSGLAGAQDYYERLILQYPYRRALPNTTSSINFYAAMFSLWIFMVSQQPHNPATSSGDIEGEGLGRIGPGPVLWHQISLQSSTARADDTAGSLNDVDGLTRVHADEIADRLDEILVSPPFSEHPWFLRLRGMVALWILDLLQGTSSSRNNRQGILAKRFHEVTPENWQELRALVSLDEDQESTRKALFKAKDACTKAIERCPTECSITLDAFF